MSAAPKPTLTIELDAEKAERLLDMLEVRANSIDRVLNPKRGKPPTGGVVDDFRHDAMFYRTIIDQIQAIRVANGWASPEDEEAA
ncbi:hypothetical protein [Methylocystis echinoides]|uniref:Uncharacterized protein n=1 Tax=Methylocystis echinoides TaxID=29468 RepID=A0A9W6LSM4_9HYPH|nr:hypothetical protein [Methylocystis echinoides]GLI93606.1 hypothetical protein LMG27198_25980 [Methylocystis echinoides]